MTRKILIGDVIQIVTARGIVYAQFTHKHQRFGSLLSIFAGFYDNASKDFSSIVSNSPAFHTFFPLQSALNEGLLSVVANVAVADRNKPFPMFRSRVIGADGQAGPWWLWDGQKEEMLRRDLTDTEKHYSLRGIISAPLLVKRIENGYRPETHSV